jgi:uncharacterized membrane protein YkvA (DUF1232 family)
MGKLRAIRREVTALASALRDPRVPLAAKVVTALVVAYALSPSDLVPDFIPVLGLLDDALLVPAGVALAVRLIPREIFAEHRARAAERATAPRDVRLGGAAMVVAIWAIALIWCLRLARRIAFD